MTDENNQGDDEDRLRPDDAVTTRYFYPPEMQYGGQKFPLGRMMITPNARDTVHPEDAIAGMLRHARGDWGECGSEDWQENEFALTRHLRLFSVYRDRNGTKFWIITEADRSATTTLLPEDY